MQLHFNPLSELDELDKPTAHELEVNSSVFQLQ